MQVRARPEIDLEEPVDALAEARGQLLVGGLEVARPGLEGEEIAVPIIVEGDGLERSAHAR